jgi:tetratricopeptide (TPR) repeat protein
MTGRAFISRFSPNRTAPAVLEAIFVQRHRLAEVWLERLRDSVLTKVKHHLLAVGPRGCGKSHLVALLVGRLRKDPEVLKRVRIAWLPEDETTPSFWKFLLRILRALNAGYGDEFPPPPRDQLANATDDRRSAFLTDYLLNKLDRRTLLVVVENLDGVMWGLKDEGQKRWRAFLQEHQVAATLATSQQLTEDVSNRDRPFFNFFQIEHLKPLTAHEALALLQKIAEYAGNTDLATFLTTPTGRARVRAIRHIAGGSHRVFIILSEFVTREKLDDLVTAFEELLDELTPYYQERLRWLPDQQREIVEFLCRQAHTVPVKEIAAELFLTEQTAAAQLKSLKDKGYATARSVGRESRYELAEPLMRLCVEVKDPQREPIRLIVEFLRIWYDRAGVEARLQCLSTDADLEQLYFHAALQAYRPGIPDPVEATLDRDLEAARATGDPEEVVRVLVELAATASSVWRCLAIAHELKERGRQAEALTAYDRAIELDPENVIAWGNKGWTLNELGQHTDALAACERATDLQPNEALAWNLKGLPLNDLGRHTEALAAYDRAIGLKPNNAIFWNNKGHVLNNLGQHAEALAAYDRAISLKPNEALAWHNKGWTLNELGRPAEALAAYNRAIELKPDFTCAWKNRGRAKLGIGLVNEAIEDLRRAITLKGTSTGTIEGRDHSADAFAQGQLALKGVSAGAFESLVEALTLAGAWGEAEQVLADRFRLPRSQDNPARSWHLPDVIVAILRASADRIIWAHRVGRLVEIAAEANALADLGDSLVRSLTKKAYAEASGAALDAWVKVWQEVADRHPDLSLVVRLFGVGVRYLQTKDERVLLDLVQEERAILRDLFGLDDGAEEG